MSVADYFKGAWRSFGSLAPERLKALRHVATIESIGSSTRIEEGGSAYDTAIADFDGDGITDLACALTNGCVLVLQGRRIK